MELDRQTTIAPEVRVVRRPVKRVADGRLQALEDVVAVEEPLEIRLVATVDGKPFQKSLSITMRTPGQDLELAAGFLFTEGIIRRREQIAHIAPCGPSSGELDLRNVVKVVLAPDVRFDAKLLERHFYTTSSCGVCGKSSIEALTMATRPELQAGPVIDAELVHRLPEIGRAAQEVFDRTGGLHASALVGLDGTLRAIREDVGRHNALDKLIGHQLFEGGLPLSESVVFLSGRASFELVQKALVAGVPILAAVGAPSSLAVDLARQFGMTLLGFVRNGRFNIYSGEERIRLPGAEG